MAETEGFTFPDRCFACREIHRCLENYEADAEIAKQELETKRHIITSSDANVEPTNTEQPLSWGARRLLADFRRTAQIRLEYTRLLTQEVFDKAEAICNGTIQGLEEEPDGGISLKDCEFPGGLPVPTFPK